MEGKIGIFRGSLGGVVFETKRPSIPPFFESTLSI